MTLATAIRWFLGRTLTLTLNWYLVRFLVWLWFYLMYIIVLLVLMLRLLNLFVSFKWQVLVRTRLGLLILDGRCWVTMKAGSATGLCILSFLFIFCTSAAPLVLRLLARSMILLVCRCTLSSWLSLATVRGDLIL